MMKNVNKPMATCHGIGACLLHPDDWACVRASLVQTRSTPQTQRLAPGVIDGPYCRGQSRSRRAAGALALVAIGLVAGAAALVQILPLARWL